MQHPENETLALEALNELHNSADVGLVKNDLLAMYKSSLTDDLNNVTGHQRVEKFHSFQHLYNFLLKIEMYNNPETTGVNLFQS